MKTDLASPFAIRIQNAYHWMRTNATKRCHASPPYGEALPKEVPFSCLPCNNQSRADRYFYTRRRPLPWHEWNRPTLRDIWAFRDVTLQSMTFSGGG
ncbi:hypothetical protein CEXT_127501 [Caerostris extrusa]|uniref:Uncharacterized protein n=1 Tax=Caerostris extrusa TaxID=172846 RepID=A0AAV4Y114_CAEEX|nr:hypothetical protein CEXT_127501 [Caerostris extrusa]